VVRGLVAEGEADVAFHERAGMVERVVVGARVGEGARW
jgi:hypothetical protein